MDDCNLTWTSIVINYHDHGYHDHLPIFSGNWSDPGTKTRIQNAMNKQTNKDLVLDYFIVDELGHHPESYGVLGRLVIDMIQLDGADINATVGRPPQTPLHHYCRKLNDVYVGKKRRLIRGDFHSDIIRRKITEYCVSRHASRGPHPDRRPATPCEQGEPGYHNLLEKLSWDHEGEKSVFHAPWKDPIPKRSGPREGRCTGLSCPGFRWVSQAPHALLLR